MRFNRNDNKSIILLNYNCSFFAGIFGGLVVVILTKGVNLVYFILTFLLLYLFGLISILWLYKPKNKKIYHNLFILLFYSFFLKWQFQPVAKDA